MCDAKFLLAMILIFIVAIAIEIDIGIVNIGDNQRTAICLDHPTYYKCKDWSP